VNILSEEIVTGLEIVSVDIVFENCEIYTVPIENINFSIELSDICNYNSYKRCAEEVRLIIKSSDNITPRFSWSYITPFYKRITQYNDITSVCLKYDDGSELDIYVPWNFEDESINSFQKPTFNTDGYLVIDIRE